MTYGSSPGCVLLSLFIVVLHPLDKIKRLAGPVPSVINRNSSRKVFSASLQTKQPSRTLRKELSSAKWGRRQGGIQGRGTELLGPSAGHWKKKEGYRGERKPETLRCGEAAEREKKADKESSLSLE